ncbi:MAG TPA: transposase, partial [Propionibacteriaceae bacterium]|nr:transposase [Propionibacteriaceae bacterium]
MTANPHSIDLSAFVAEHLEHAEPDVLRWLLSSFIQALMSAEAEAICGAGYGVRSSERANSRNGYRSRDFDTRAGTLEVAIPRWGGILLSGVAAGASQGGREGSRLGGGDRLYLLGVSTRRMEKLVEQLGITRLSKSQVSVMARELDEQVPDFRSRPLDQGLYTFLAADALTMKVRE